MRKNNKLSQEQIAKMINVTQRAYSGYELETSEPTIETLCTLADYYDVSLDYIVGRERKNDLGFLTPKQLIAISYIKLLNEENLTRIIGRLEALVEMQ